MKALSLHQPWASLVALGVKNIETRSWATSYRGPLAIHAAKRKPDEGTGLTVPSPIPLGAVVATCVLVDVVPIVEEIPAPAQWREPWGVVTVEPWLIEHYWPGFGNPGSRYVGDQLPYGNFAVGRYAWLLDGIKALPEPVPVRGRQGLFECGWPSLLSTGGGC